MKTNIIVPAYNNLHSLNKLLVKIRKRYSYPIVVVDDGSIPKLNIDSIDNIKLLRNNINRGKGYSLQKALEFSYNNNYDFSITIDSDLQHDPIFIDDFIKISNNFDLVLGRRKFNKKMPYLRRFSNFITSFIISKISRIKIYDSQCGYRRYNLSKFNLCSYNEDGFQFESEVIIAFSRIKAKISHVDISTIYGDEKSAMNHISDTIKFIKMIFRNLGF